MVVVGTAHALAHINGLMLAAAAPAVRASLHVDTQVMGALLGPALAAGYGAGALVAGALAGRVDKGKVMIAGLVIWSTASAMSGTVQGTVGLALARFALGAGQAAFIPTAFARVVDTVPLASRASAVTAFTIGSTVGRGAALLIAGLVLTLLGELGLPEASGGWRVLFVLTAVPNLLLLAAVVGAVRATGDIGRPLPARGPATSNFAMIAGYMLLAMAPAVATQAVAAWLPTWVAATRGEGAATAATFVGALTLVAAPLGQLAGGALMTRWPGLRPRAPLVIAAAVTAALPWFAVIAHAPRAVTLAAGIIGLNLTLGVGSFTALFGLQALLPHGRRTRGNASFLALVTVVGVGLGPWMTGVLSERGGDAAIGGALLNGGAALAALACVAALVVGRPYARAAAREATA